MAFGEFTSTAQHLYDKWIKLIENAGKKVSDVRDCWNVSFSYISVIFWSQRIMVHNNNSNTV